VTEEGNEIKWLFGLWFVKGPVSRKRKRWYEAEQVTTNSKNYLKRENALTTRSDTKLENTASTKRGLVGGGNRRITIYVENDSRRCNRSESGQAFV